jgi:threonyl-tRNA synthetase
VLKVPYMLVVGDKEREADSVAVRRHKEGDLGVQPLDDFAERALHEIADRR